MESEREVPAVRTAVSTDPVAVFGDEVIEIWVSRERIEEEKKLARAFLEGAA